MNQPVKTKRIVSYEEWTGILAAAKTNGLRQTISAGIQGGFHGAGELRIRDFADDNWHTISERGVMTSPPTALALHDHDAWLGGEGYVAVADLDQMKISRYYRIPGTVIRICTAGGYAWVQAGTSLYRVAQ
jgi:hypothetical protein